MDISNIDIVLIDYLYNYENIYDNSLKNTLYFELKSDIYNKTLLNKNNLEKNEHIELTNKINRFFDLFNNFNFEKIYNHPDPIKYITYLSFIKYKLIKI
jgi:hypothetical protein